MTTIKKNIAVTDSVDINRFASLVNALCQFESSVSIAKENKIVDAKSIMGVLSLGITKGNDIVIEAEGADAEIAVEAVRKFIY